MALDAPSGAGGAAGCAAPAWRTAADAVCRCRAARVSATRRRADELAPRSCLSTKECTAVGDYYSKSDEKRTLAEAWNGTTWAIQEVPSPAEARFTELAKVSCTSSTACTAVGQTLGEAKTSPWTPLVERWNGTTWALQEAPSPVGAGHTSLQSVSCTATAACAAVGSYVNSSGVIVTLAESWNGTKWAIQETPNPTGAKMSELFGISCTSTENCIATGSYKLSDNLETTLGEHYL